MYRGGGLEKKTFRGGMDIFLNYTIFLQWKNKWRHDFLILWVVILLRRCCRPLEFYLLSCGQYSKVSVWDFLVKTSFSVNKYLLCSVKRHFECSQRGHLAWKVDSRGLLALTQCTRSRILFAKGQTIDDGITDPGRIFQQWADHTHNWIMQSNCQVLFPKWLMGRSPSHQRPWGPTGRAITGGHIGGVLGDSNARRACWSVGICGGSFTADLWQALCSDSR